MRNRLVAAAVAAALVVGAQLVAFTTSAHAAVEGIDLGAVHLTKTISRSHLAADGTSTVADQRTIILDVAQTKGLRSRQPVRVSWRGAHPTGGVIGDPTSETANTQEYPFVLLECHGVDDPSLPLAQQLRPETCWTGSMKERDAAETTTTFGAWRLDRFATPEERRARVGIPDPLPKSCATEYKTRGRWVHFRSASGVDYASEGSGDSNLGRCGTSPAESVVVANASQPSNNQYVATGADGTGNTKFTAWTSEDNASLGCGGEVRCSLVAVPIMGISCDESATGLPAEDVPAAADVPALSSACRSKGAFAPGSLRTGGTPERAVTGELWWSASNWRNRLTVPLSYAPLASVCDITGGKDSVDIYGSELLTSLTSLWRPAFCLNSARTPFKHIQLPEPQAANLLHSGNVDAAFISRPPEGGFGAGTVAAPVAVTGFAISYTIDGDDREPYHSLRLTPRLIAKLLTASYPGLLAVQVEHTALSRNPLDITLDPEFQALNPGLVRGRGAVASTLANLSSDSDVIYALTSYLNADAATRDFLYGVPDPWGMVVNPAYRRIALPVNNWPLLDDFMPTTSYATGLNLCLQANPVPIVPLIQSPTSRLASIASTVQFAIQTQQLVCQAVDGLGAVGAKLVGSGRETPGGRFVLGLTSLADAARYDLDTAALQTAVSDAAPVKFTGGQGRTFVAPTQDSLRTAATQFVLDATSGLWTYPFGEKAPSSSQAAGYPGTMLVSLALASKGLKAVEAAGYADLLAFAADAGQRPGLDIGDLPPGYLPLTEANGLARQRDQLLRAIPVIRAQSGAAVPVLAPAPTAAPAEVPKAAPSVAPVGIVEVVPPTFTPSGTSGSFGGGQPSVPTPSVGTAPSPPPTTAATPPVVAVVNVGATPLVGSGLAASLFPSLLLVAGILGLASQVVGRRVRVRARS